ncbi:leucyl aminopeptidase [Brevibacillus sp. SYSU BS000544]|uniref:leucyl aminopeptidase n=1 Tax=Brevibacillus sp. SYSU BS000544 TaxID=3416443 RepID=UPI003CE52CE5
MIQLVRYPEDLAKFQCDELVIPVFKNELENEYIQIVDTLLQGGLKHLIQEEEITGEQNQVTVVHALGKVAAKKVIILGLGEKDASTFVSVRNAFARAVKTIAAKGEDKTIGLVLIEPSTFSLERFVQAAAEAFYLASYTYEGYREKPGKKKSLKNIQLLVKEKDWEAAASGSAIGTALSTGTVLARDLVNTPANYLTPSALKDAIVEVAEKYSMSYEVLEQAKLKELGMGGVLSVAQGSVEPPYVVAVKYQGKETWDDVIGLIGKGVTFDTGGISIKPVAGMEEMKSDMGGSASVLGALEAIGQMKPKANVLVVIGCVENMPSGTAYKPGDVITTMSKKTVEIITTDAEGRLVLADCITYAKEQGVSCLIDCATLTGGVVVALGTISSGAMSNNQQLVLEVLAGAEQAGERLWQLPTFEEYRELNKSRVADLKNSGGRNGHAIIAGVFLEAFVGDTPWVHLDNAGTAYVGSGTDLNPAGATGAMTRSIAQFVLNRGK